MPRIKKSVISKLPEDYDVRLAIAKLEQIENDAQRLRLANEKTQIDIDKTKENLCYISVAMNEFQSALANIGRILKDASSRMSQELDLTPQQADKADKFFNSVLSMLSDIDIRLSSTDEVDAKLSHAGASEKKAKRGC